jgi:hypothetical protein
LPGLAYRVCARCGVVLEGSGGKVCPACAAPDRTERIVYTGIRVLEARKQTGVDPSHGGEAARRRGEKMRQRMSEVRAWEAQHPRPDLEVFRREILPLLRTVYIRRIPRFASRSGAPPWRTDRTTCCAGSATTNCETQLRLEARIPLAFSPSLEGLS